MCVVLVDNWWTWQELMFHDVTGFWSQWIYMDKILCPLLSKSSRKRIKQRQLRVEIPIGMEFEWKWKEVKLICLNMFDWIQRNQNKKTSKPLSNVINQSTVQNNIWLKKPTVHKPLSGTLCTDEAFSQANSIHFPSVLVFD